MAKIVQLTTVHPIGDTRVFRRECRALVHAGHRVVLVAVHAQDETVEGVDIRALPRPTNRAQRMTTLMWRAYRRARAEAADVYHFHDPELIPLGILLKLSGHRVVYDVHEDVPLQILVKHWIAPGLTRPIAFATRVIEGVAARILDGIVAATPSIADKFPAHKTITVQNFPDLDEVASESVSYVSRPVGFVYVGTVAAIRGAREMVAAVQLLHARYPFAKLEVLGPVRPHALLELLREHGGELVEFTGWASHAQVRSALARARAGLVVLHPTRNYIESYPVKLFEYMSAGVPVIASDFPLFRRIVEDAGAGLLVDPLDPQGIADAMAWMLDHPDEAAAMGRRGRDAVREHYSWGREAKKLVRFYDRLLARSRSPDRLVLFSD